MEDDEEIECFFRILAKNCKKIKNFERYVNS